MMKNNFQTLIEELRTDPVVFIDNDFSPVNKPGEIFEFVVFLQEDDYILLDEILSDIDIQLAQKFKKLRQDFAQLNLDETGRKYLKSPAAVNYLSKNVPGDLAKEVAAALEIIEKNLKEEGNELAGHIMNFGLIAKDAYASYKPFFQSLEPFDGLRSIRIYKDLLGDKFNLFKHNIEKTLEIKGKDFYLMIVDKKLTGYEGDEIISQLRKDGGKVSNFFSVLFTSKDGEKIDPQNFEEYFQLQLTKSDKDVINKVSAGLALCAYARFFDLLRTTKKSVIDESFELITNEGKQNMLYLAEMAHAEGTTVFNVINKWFDLLTEKKVADAISGKHNEIPLDYNFITGLTSILNSGYIEIEPVSSERFEKEVKELKTFELFNHNINELYLPPAPGDIYRIDSSLYILAGQECDLIVRGKGKNARRKEKLAELIKCNFSAVPLDGKTFDTESTLSLNHFLIDDRQGALEIDFKKRSLYDFRLLDLCSTNASGCSVLMSGGNLQVAAQKALPKAWESYYPQLASELTNKIKVLAYMRKENISGGELSPDESLSLVHTASEDSISFPVQRIARLKGGFKEYFLQRYWQYKTRKGLDTIALYNQKDAVIEQVECGFFENHEKVNMESPLSISLQLTGDHDKNRDNSKLALIIPKTELSLLLNEKQRELLNSIPGDEIKIVSHEYKENATKIIFGKKHEEGKISLTITFPFYNEITGSYFVVKNKMSLSEILSPDFISKSQIPADAIYFTGEEQFPLYEGNKLRKLSLADIEKGVYIPSLEVAFKIEKSEGILKIMEIPPTKAG